MKIGRLISVTFAISSDAFNRKTKSNRLPNGGKHAKIAYKNGGN